LEENKRRRGRPVKKGDGNNVRLDVRIGQDEKDALEHMLIESDRNKSEIIRRAIMLYYRSNRGRW
jgi:hypothetical protein